MIIRLHAVEADGSRILVEEITALAEAEAAREGMTLAAAVVVVATEIQTTAEEIPAVADQEAMIHAVAVAEMIVRVVGLKRDINHPFL